MNRRVIPWECKNIPCMVLHVIRKSRRVQDSNGLAPFCQRQTLKETEENATFLFAKFLGTYT